MIRYFVVTHTAPAWPVPRFMELVSTVPAGDDARDLGQRYPHLAGRNAQLSEYSTLFGVRRELEDEDADRDAMVGLAHYRRYAVTGPLKDAPPGTALRPAQFVKISRDRFIPPSGTLLCQAPVLAQPSVLAQHATYHHSRDLVRLMGLAVDHGLLTGDRVAEGLSGPMLVPAPTVGVFPRRWLLDLLRAFEALADDYTDTFAVPREGYQQRALAFALERLHSMLLIDLVAGWPPDRVVAHPPLVVSADGVIRQNDGPGTT